jgi:hypothetical protein
MQQKTLISCSGLWSFVGEGFFVGYAFGPHFRLPGGLRSVPKCHVEMEGAQERISSVPATCPGSSPVPNINMYAICHIALPFDGWKPANRQKKRWSRHETQTRQIFSNLTFHQSDQNVCQTERQNFCQVKFAKDLPDRTPYLMPDRTPEATPEEITDNRMPECMPGFMWRGGRSKQRIVLSLCLLFSVFRFCLFHNKRLFFSQFDHNQKILITIRKFWLWSENSLNKRFFFSILRIFVAKLRIKIGF